jgi:hypothetical protein
VRKIFRRKIKYPYERLLKDFKDVPKATNDTQNELIFDNKSEISVDTSVRSGTYNYLHVSEYATIAMQYPEKAAEIRTGSFNTVHPGNYIFVESTGRGKGGEFFDLVQASRKLRRTGRRLTQLDFKYHFYPWWMNPKYVLSEEDTKQAVFNRQQTEYFNKVEKVMDTKLTLPQRAWYVMKKQWNGDDMKREYPSTDDEPFEAILKGALFGDQMAEAHEHGRIRRVPHEPGLAVDTWWDIGRRDMTAIWFVQSIGFEFRFIWYHEEAFKELPHFVKLLNQLRMEHKWNYRYHLAPHDMATFEWGGGKTRFDQALQLGYRFEIGKQYKQEDQINAARTMLPNCWFDAENCAVGIGHLEQVRREWNEYLQTYMEKYRHDEHSHGSSAFMNGCMMIGGLTRGRARAHQVASLPFAT